MKRFQVLHRHLDPNSPPPLPLLASSCAAQHNTHPLANVSTSPSLSDHWRLGNIKSGQCYVDGNGTERISILGAEKYQFAVGKECGVVLKECLGQIAPQPNDEHKKHKSLHKKQVVLIVGAGDATGGAVAKRFAKEGFVVCIVRRKQEKLFPLQEDILRAGGEVHAFGVDARKEDEMVALVEQIETSIGEIKVAVYNIGANVKFGILETTSRVFFKVWEMACFAGFLTGREVAKYMVPRGEGTIIFTGATASVRGSAGFAAFAGAKFALRALAQSMARELGSKGVHVAHVVIDAAINTSWTLQNLKDASDLVQQNAVVQPENVADLYWQIHQQPRSAWSHELDLRPWKEPW